MNEPAARRVARLSRLEQGLPAHVSDALTLDRLAALLDGENPRKTNARTQDQLPHRLLGDGPDAIPA